MVAFIAKSFLLFIPVFPLAYQDGLLTLGADDDFLGPVETHHHARKEDQNMVLAEKQDLIEAADHYLATLNEIGAVNSKCPSEEIASLCAKSCRKIRNGKLLFEGRESFAAQLDAGKEWLGGWSIGKHAVLIATDKRAATIHYELNTEKEGDLLVIVILYFDSNYKISEINEVHNRLEK